MNSLTTKVDGLPFIREVRIAKWAAQIFIALSQRIGITIAVAKPHAARINFNRFFFLFNSFLNSICGLHPLNTKLFFT